MKKQPTIMVNGQNYTDFKNLPDFVQKIFSDRDGNGIPDIFEGKIGDMMFKNMQGLRTFNVKGQTYNSFQEMPAEIRQQVEGKLKQLTGLNLGSQFNWPKQQPQPWQGEYATTDGASNKWLWLMVGVGLAFVAIMGVAALAFFLLYR